MAYDSRAVANYMLDRAFDHGLPLTPMQVLKLVYIAHGWHLAIFRKPLIRDAIEAWEYGPVIPKLYHAIKKYGSRPVTGPVTVFDPDADDFETKVEAEFTDQEKALMDRVLELYGELKAFQLSALTHKAGTPWHQMKTDPSAGVTGVQIPNNLIEGHFEELGKR